MVVLASSVTKTFPLQWTVKNTTHGGEKFFLVKLTDVLLKPNMQDHISPSPFYLKHHAFVFLV